MTGDGDEPRALRLLVGAELVGRRADEAVLRSFPGFSRKEVKELFEAGRVRGSGGRLKKGDRVERGMQLSVQAPDVPITPDPTIALELLFESDDFVIVNKPAGFPTAPLAATPTRPRRAGGAPAS